MQVNGMCIGECIACNLNTNRDCSLQAVVHLFNNMIWLPRYCHSYCQGVMSMNLFYMRFFTHIHTYTAVIKLHIGVTIHGSGKEQLTCLANLLYTLSMSIRGFLFVTKILSYTCSQPNEVLPC